MGPLIEDRRTGPAAAAALAAGVGCVVLGLLSVLCDASAELKRALEWWPPSGCLFGKVAVAVPAWLAAWFVLHRALRSREFCFDAVLVATGVLLLAGVLLTCPLFPNLFGSNGNQIWFPLEPNSFGNR
jgi:hypothetical protein